VEERKRNVVSFLIRGLIHGRDPHNKRQINKKSAYKFKFYTTQEPSEMKTKRNKGNLVFSPTSGEKVDSGGGHDLRHS
jgi:hypothetical protein